MIVVCIESFDNVGFNIDTRKEIRHPKVPLKDEVYQVTNEVHWHGKLYYELFEFKDCGFLASHFKPVDVNINEVFEEEHNYVGT